MATDSSSSSPRKASPSRPSDPMAISARIGLVGLLVPTAIGGFHNDYSGLDWRVRTEPVQ